MTTRIVEETSRAAENKGSKAKADGGFISRIELLVKLSLIAGPILVVLGFAAIFEAPASLLYVLEFLGFIILLTPASILAVLKNKTPWPIPRWLALSSIVVFDVTSIPFIGGAPVNHVVGLVSVLSILIPLFVTFRVTRSFLRPNQELDVGIDK